MAMSPTSAGRFVRCAIATVLAAAALSFLPPCASTCLAEDTSSAAVTTSDETIGNEKLVLFINSYDPGFDTVPVVSSQISQALRGHASIQYLYMNEKYESDEFASAQLSTQLDHLTTTYHYDAIILGDDAAFDFAIKNREKYFSGIPLIYEGVNSVEKAALYKDDPLITGVVEAFPMKETIALAKKVVPNATHLVVISDGSVSAAGSVQQAMDEQGDFPDLSFSTFDCSTRTPSRIRSDIAKYGDDTILLYTVFNTDGSGNRYSVSQGVKLVTDAANVPVFKADGVGVGDGLLGGYVLSYESIGKQTGDIVLDVLDGDSVTAVNGYTTGSCEYLFDAKVMARYGISKSQLPDSSTYINDSPTFLDIYGTRLMWGFIAAAAVLLCIVMYNLARRRRLQAELASRDLELKTEEAASRAKTEFISRMSHDIRTPLNAMLGMNELALEDIGDEAAVRGYLEKSRSSGELLLSLVSNVLDVSKIESGKMQLTPAPCEIGSFVDGLGNIFGPPCERKDITLRIRHDAGDVIVLADRMRLNQVFCNLLSNSVKFTPEGGEITLTLTSRRATADDGSSTNLSCDFTVADNGTGMSADFQEKMFQPFTQESQQSAETSGQGSGLGLTIVKRIVDLMGGTIKVDSAPGKGSRFFVHLDFPIADSQDAPDAMTDDAAEADDGKLAGRKVLLVEDNPLNSEITSTVLGRKGMEITHVANGQEALDLVTKAPDNAFDVILMDNRMPVMDGLEATRRIRALGREWTSSVPIIATTADVFADDLKSLLDAGMNAWVTKPIDMGKLCETIARLTKR